MSFWTTQQIRQAINGSDPVIVRADYSRLNVACYEMALGNEGFVTGDGGIKRTYRLGDQIRIPPGQLALLLTEEELALPHDVLAFISIKASKKMSGLVNVSGFHVDPGFRGRLKFSVYNAGAEAIIIQVGEPLFPIWFTTLDSPNEKKYSGKHQGQMGLSSNDVNRLQGDLASPSALKEKLDDLNRSVQTWRAVTIAIALAVFGAYIRTLFD